MRARPGARDAGMVSLFTPHNPRANGQPNLFRSVPAPMILTLTAGGGARGASCVEPCMASRCFYGLGSPLVVFVGLRESAKMWLRGWPAVGAQHPRFYWRRLL
jgi:hypothetical protein